MKHLVPILAALLFAPLHSHGAPEPAPGKPNIIVILMDDMGYGDIAPFGSKLNRTPNLDRMAAEGMTLTDFYCAPVCTASRAQLMTGCYAKRVSLGLLMPVSSTGINPDEWTVAELLKTKGYSTMAAGKWHLGDQPEFLPTRNGFDHFFGLPYSNDMDGEEKVAGKPNKGKSSPRPPLPLLRDETVIEAPAKQETLTKRFTEESVNFIRTHKDGPFFLYLAHIAVHVPLRPGEDFRGKSANGTYGDWVEESDWSVGRILDTLKELKLDKNTLVLFTSDNGPWLAKKQNCGVATPFRGGKFSTWEGGMREPTLAWWPGKIRAGSVCGTVLSQIDVLPTCIGLAGGEIPKDRRIDGRDMWPVLSGKTTESPHDGLFYFDGNTLAAVRSGPWKLVVTPQSEGPKDNDPKKIDASFESPRLYHLGDDPGETTNVAAEHPDVVSRLQKLIALMYGDLGGGKGHQKNRGPGIRPAGHVANPQPLLMRSSGNG